MTAIIFVPPEDLGLHKNGYQTNGVEGHNVDLIVQGRVKYHEALNTVVTLLAARRWPI
jgi:hypothetical protein